MMKFICDTNIIIRYLMQDNDDLQTQALNIFDQVLTGAVTLVIEQAVFAEVIFVLSSNYLVPKPLICDQLGELLSYKGIECDKHHLLSALEFYRRHNMHIVDCILMAKPQHEDMHILSFDKKLLKANG